MKAVLILALFCVGGCAVHMTPSGPRLGDEGEWLGEKIGTEAQKLRASGGSELVFAYQPESGVDQLYSIGVGKSPWPCPIPCGNQSALTVSLSRGPHGSTTYHKRFVGVPNPLTIHKDRQPTEIVLRKNGDAIELVEFR